MDFDFRSGIHQHVFHDLPDCAPVDGDLCRFSSGGAGRQPACGRSLGNGAKLIRLDDLDSQFMSPFGIKLEVAENVVLSNGRIVERTDNRESRRPVNGSCKWGSTWRKGRCVPDLSELPAYRRRNSPGNQSRYASAQSGKQHRAVRQGALCLAREPKRGGVGSQNRGQPVSMIFSSQFQGRRCSRRTHRHCPAMCRTAACTVQE